MEFCRDACEYETQAKQVAALANLSGCRLLLGEISGEVVNTVLFTLVAADPPADHRLTAFRLIGPKSPEEKDRLLREALRAGNAERYNAS